MSHIANKFTWVNFHKIKFYKLLIQIQMKGKIKSMINVRTHLKNNIYLNVYASEKENKHKCNGNKYKN